MLRTADTFTDEKGSINAFAVNRAFAMARVYVIPFRPLKIQTGADCAVPKDGAVFWYYEGNT